MPENDDGMNAMTQMKDVWGLWWRTVAAVHAKLAKK